jgi:CheY-like chemotaxis protein
VVDDRRDQAEPVARVLEAAGYAAAILVSREPELILARILEATPDVLVLDYDLGGDHPQGGEEVLELLAATPASPVVITHSQTDLAFRRETAFKRFESRFTLHHVMKLHFNGAGGMLDILASC